MANIIKVDTAKLRSASAEFASASAQIRNATNSMTQTVTSLTGTIWQGDAATAYINKFNGLQDEIAAIDRMINEHSDDLIQMANEYDRVQDSSVQTANSLNDTLFT